jgi:hypothetical protein
VELGIVLNTLALCGREALDSIKVKVSAAKAISLFALDNRFIIPPMFAVLWRCLFRPEE